MEDEDLPVDSIVANPKIARRAVRRYIHRASFVNIKKYIRK